MNGLRGLRPAGRDRPEARVLRGGAWNNDNPDNFRAANRNNNEPIRAAIGYANAPVECEQHHPLPA